MNVRYFMRKRERYKHLLNLFANFVMLVAETAMFAFIWYKMYVPELEDKFWNRGNWAVIGMYALVLFFFIRTFGGYRIGYLRITDLFVADPWNFVCKYYRVFSDLYDCK